MVRGKLRQLPSGEYRDGLQIANIDKMTSYKDGKVRYEFLQSRQSRRDLPRDNSLVSVEVLRYDYKRSNVNKGIVRTEMELVLEHTQQGTSNEVSMEILLELTSNKLMVGDLSDTDAGNPVKEILLKIDLLDHRSVLTDSKVHIKMEMISTCSSRVKFIATCSYSRLNNFATSRKNDLKLLQL
ncbi:hypothetical protein Tco_0857425 [Tanacetum coccineum]|uniref:C2 NT-type domain-containing protein n=1 Tax=Tanacetum coccineum TaxID=301880 RepID=A0ABQ5BA60_9ASTR